MLNDTLPHMLRELNTLSTKDLAMLILYLNKEVYQEFSQRITTCPQEELEEMAFIYRKMKEEIGHSQNALAQMDQYFYRRIKDLETVKMHKAMREPVVIPITDIDPELLKAIRSEK